jgi:hypothetical protein
MPILQLQSLNYIINHQHQSDITSHVTYGQWGKGILLLYVIEHTTTSPAVAGGIDKIY